MPPKSAPMTQAAIRRMIKESVDVAIAAERARQANVRNDASGSGPVRGQDTAPAVRECTFAGFMKCNPAVFYGVEGAVELQRWFEKTESVFEISECTEGKKVKFDAATLEGPALTWWKTKVATMGLETVNQIPWTEMKQLMTIEFCPIEEVQRMEHELWNLKVKEYDVVAYTHRFNELALMCPRMVEPERVKVDAYIRGLTDNIKGEVTSSKPADLNEAMRMTHKLMEHKLKTRDERDFGRKEAKNSQKQGNAQAMVTAPTNGKLPLCERCFTHHVGQCTINCHMCGKVGHKARYYKEKNVATGANAQPIWTCYDCGEQGHTRNRCPKKIKQEEVGEVCGRAYAIKDAKPQGPNVVTGTFLLNNRYAFVLFDSGFDRSFVDTRFSSMLDIDPVKIGASYEVELADGRVVSVNTILKGCTLNLVNHVFKIGLMPIELSMFDVIISMDWLIKHDAIIVCSEKFVRTPYGNKMLIVESDKGVSRLKVISYIKACKYVKRGCLLFLAHLTENKLNEKRLEDVPVIRNFPEVFPEELPGLPPPRQVEFQIDLVPGVVPVARAPYRLASSEMKELLIQLQELLEKGFIHVKQVTLVELIDLDLLLKIIMMNVIPPDHVDDLPVVEPNQHNDVPIIPELVLVDENEDPEEEEFEEEEEPQEEEDDMEVNIEEDNNEPELTYPYEECEDETVPASIYEVGESSTAPFLREDSDGLLPGLIRRDINSLFGRMASLSRRLCGREKAYAMVEKKGKAKDEYYGKLILDLRNEVRSSVKERTAVMENLVRKLDNAKEKAECKKLKKELEEARGFMFEERPNEANDVLVEDEKSPSSKPRGSPPAVWRMIKESVDAAIGSLTGAKTVNDGNDARGSGPVRGQDAAPAVCESTFAEFMKCDPTVFRGIEGAVELRRWFEKTKSVFGISECEEGKKVKFDTATLQGTTLT
ncbi:putative reverse transcriptase domain-containing protein [Tanacetum coccineum]